MSARKSNPPIPGHELQWEGRMWVTKRWDGERYVSDGWSGGCRCGAQPPEAERRSANAVKRWHRQHKAELRAQENVT